MKQVLVLTFVHRVDGDEEDLSQRLVVHVAEDKVEAVVTFDPGSVFVPEPVEVHVILSEVLTGGELDPTGLRLQKQITSQT